MKFDPSLIPGRLQGRPKDRRGYPIPWTVMIDSEGNPHFTIQDRERGDRAIMERRCALCGQKLEWNTWLIGGPSAAFHDHGAYLDPPLHKDCGIFALRVCPFLSRPYSGRIDDKTLKAAEREGYVIIEEQMMQTEQPAFFVLARVTSYRVITQDGSRYILPKRPFKATEFWKDGIQIDDPEAERLFASFEHNRCSREELTWWVKK